jgi:serine phosphatase RsbU (regulator of sigma subunit)
MDPAGVLFGNARLMEAIGRGRSVPLKESVAALVGEVEHWRGAAGSQDDISIVAIEVPVISGRGEMCPPVP